MRSDGSNVKQLTTVIGDKDTPVFSPDGRRIAFAMSDTGSSGVPTLLYRWSPDESRFAYATDGGAGFGSRVSIWTASTTDASGAVQLTADADGRNWSPDWTRH
jgi:Tol biopolymer transport system component